MSVRGRLLLAASGLLCATLCQAAPDFAGEPASDDARFAADAGARRERQRGRPFAIVDKHDARIYVFEADGRLIGASAVLLGAALGDPSFADAALRIPGQPDASTSARRRPGASRPAGQERQGRGDRLDRLRRVARDPPPARRAGGRAAVRATRVAARRRQADLARLHRRSGRVLRSGRGAQPRPRPERRLRPAGNPAGAGPVRVARPRAALTGRASGGSPPGRPRQGTIAGTQPFPPPRTAWPGPFPARRAWPT